MALNLLLGNDRRRVLVSHCNVDGSFLIHHIIKDFLSSNSYKVVLVGLCQTFTHYNVAAQKLGVALTKACQQGQLVFIDCLSRSALSDKHEKLGTVEIEKGRWAVPLDMARPLEAIGQLISSQLDQNVEETSRRNVIIIDELLVLLSVDLGSRDLISFLTCCEQMTQCDSARVPRQGSLVYFLRCDSDVDDEEAKSLLLHLRHRSNLHVQLSGLNTGYSQLVHGNIVVERKDCIQVVPGNSHWTEMHYRVLDKGLSVFPKGMVHVI
ncbi:elongator complex protein 6-like [Corticium candelabrum]|uniref:elongator complex protein 6-like n=1 Tax=Corticium candelabrum TaxID=121492 RepID=UPI002E25D383|nr:elongator complex protein 6-like [Corticium candelabrum]